MGHHPNFTAQMIERAKAPVDKPWVLIRDGKVNHLALIITAKGTKSFVWDGRAQGEKYRRQLGTWPTMALETARARAHEINALVEARRDPFKEAADAEK